MPSVKLTKLEIPVSLPKRPNIKLTRNYLQKANEKNDYIVYHKISNGEVTAELSMKTLADGKRFIAFEKGPKDRFQAMLSPYGTLLAFSKTSATTGKVKNSPSMFDKFQTQILRMKTLFELK